MIAIRNGTMRAMPKAGLKPGSNLSNLSAGPPPYNGKGGPNRAKLSAKAIGGIIIIVRIIMINIFLVLFN
jgi:hypothetical protein